MSVMVAVSVPLRVSGVAMQQAALILALIGALIIFCVKAEIRSLVKQTITSRLGALVGSIFLVWTITVFFSFDPLGSLKIGGRTGLFILAVTIVWAVLKTHQENYDLLLKVFICAAFVSCSAAALSLAGVPMILSIVKANLDLVEVPRLAFKAFAASALCMLPVIIWAGRRIGGPWRFWAYAYLPLVIVVIMEAENRSSLAGLLAMIGAGMVVVILNKHRHSKTLFLFAVAGGTAILAWIRHDRMVMTTRHLKGMYLPEWLVDPHRQLIWKFAYHKFLDHPWFGNGIDQLNRLAGAHTVAPGLGKTAYLIPSHPHSWFLEVLAESGIIGVLPVIITLAYISWELTNHFLNTQDEGALARLTLMAGFWASALFNFSIWAVWWQLTFFMLFAIISAAPPAKNMSHQNLQP